MLKIYCDGACSGNPGPGGWAFIIPDLNIERAGFIDDTTNNRMELTAVIEALTYISAATTINATALQTKKIEIITDSQYIVNTMTKGWRKNKNMDLWHMLDYLISFGWIITWTWVRGHADDIYNARCDELAVNAYKNQSVIYNTKTVWERLREMSVEEFAKWLYSNLYRLHSSFGGYSGTANEAELLKWLNSKN